MLTLSPEHNFVESDADALHNLALTTGIVLDCLEGIIQSHDDTEIQQLWQVARALQTATEVYYD
jgi:hypothetical protein